MRLNNVFVNNNFFAQGINERAYKNFEDEEYEIESGIKNIFSNDNKEQNIDMSADDILNNYGKTLVNQNNDTMFDLPEGHSKFEFEGARFEIFKRGNTFQTQFVMPKHMHQDRFFEHFPELRRFMPENPHFEDTKNQNIEKNEETKEETNNINVDENNEAEETNNLINIDENNDVKENEIEETTSNVEEANEDKDNKTIDSSDDLTANNEINNDEEKEVSNEDIASYDKEQEEQSEISNNDSADNYVSDNQDIAVENEKNDNASEISVEITDDSAAEFFNEISNDSAIKINNKVEDVIISNDIKINDTISTKSNLNVNGILDESVIQGDTGDCWLIAGLYSMAKTVEGADIIKNSITLNDNSTVTVTFKGIGISYDITEDEINAHDTDDNLEDAYSNGDNDMLVMELAVEKLWYDINSGKVKLQPNDTDLEYSGEGGGINNGGLPEQIIYYLTGIEAKSVYNYNLRSLNQTKVYNVLNKALNSDSVILNAIIYNGTHSATLTDGNKYSMYLGNYGHALSVTNVTEDSVTLINPWDTSKSYEMSWEEFVKLGIGYITYADLKNAVETENNVNMTEGSVDLTKDLYDISNNIYSDLRYRNFFGNNSIQQEVENTEENTENTNPFSLVLEIG